MKSRTLHRSTLTALALGSLVACSHETSESPDPIPEPSPRESSERTIGEKITEGGSKAAEKIGSAVDEGVKHSGEAVKKTKRGILEGVDKLGDKMREGADRIDKLVEDKSGEASPDE